MDIERAGPADRASIEALVTAAGLPLDGVADAFETGLVIRSEGAVVAAAAVEPYGTAGLLRSVVVDPRVRGTGLGRRIVEASERLATELGIRELYLLTETASDWFPRLGYRAVERASLPVAIRNSVEFTSACATTAVAMTRRLDS
ncbi:MAG TPA: arsenic resistance N-acetyltransferase ArsN2 [Clostridia bacterium]|nr:arsenic resistance N-acetyltransferase ArsN2 [Clostridia bacterium]